jgi:small subunit ribosomal protein S9
MPTASTTAESPAGDELNGVFDDAQASTPTEEVPGAGQEDAAPDSAEAAHEAAGEVPDEYSTETPAEEAPAEDAPAAGHAFTGPALATGRRKEAIARVRISPGNGEWRINGHKLEEFFPNKVHQQLVNEPFVTLSAEGRFDLVALISGGGVTGQAGALRLAIARALAEVDPENRPALKKAGFLTRDARVKERKKYGLKKARKAPQYSKR